jgi:hypothetical protein
MGKFKFGRTAFDDHPDGLAALWRVGLGSELLDIDRESEAPKGDEGRGSWAGLLLLLLGCMEGKECVVLRSGVLGSDAMSSELLFLLTAGFTRKWSTKA